MKFDVWLCFECLLVDLYIESIRNREHPGKSARECQMIIFSDIIV